MPESTCFFTTPATAARIFAASPVRPTGTPSSLANIARIRSSGRGRLPVWVVRNRLIPYAVSSSDTPESPSFARSKLKRSDFASAKHESSLVYGRPDDLPMPAIRREGVVRRAVDDGRLQSTLLSHLEQGERRAVWRGDFRNRPSQARGL